MVWFRKGLVALFSFLLFLALLDTVFAYNLNSHFGNSSNIKQWLADSNIYDAAITSVLNDTQNQSDKKGGDGSISLKDPLVQQAAKQTFSPQLLQTSADTFIDSNYDWLKGKTLKPEYVIDLTKTKETFAQHVGTAVEKRLAALPVCTGQQEAQLQIPVNVLSVPCRPGKLDPKTEGKRVANEIRGSDFLTEPVLTADNFAHDKTNKTSKPYYQRLSRAPDVFQAEQAAPLVLVIISLVFGGLIIAIHPDNRKGWRRIGSVFMFTGVVLTVSKLFSNLSINSLKNEISKSDTIIGQLHQPLIDLARHVQSEFSRTNMIFGLIFIAIAVLIYVILFTTRGGSKPKRPRAPLIPEEVPVEKPKAPVKKAPVDTGAGQKPTGPPVFKAASATPKRKNPRPPRLIQ